MSYSRVIRSLLGPKNIAVVLFPISGAYIGYICDTSETQSMIRYRDRSALYGRPPPPPGVKEIPSW